MTSKEIREMDISDSRNGSDPCLELQVILLREIAAQLAESNEGIRLLVPKPACRRCDGQGWICIHCDKSITKCECPEDGSQNPALCDRCGVGIVNPAPQEPEYYDEDIVKENNRHTDAMAQPVSDPDKFTRCDICEKEFPRPSGCSVGETAICDYCIPF